MAWDTAASCCGDGKRAISVGTFIVEPDVGEEWERIFLGAGMGNVFDVFGVVVGHKELVCLWGGGAEDLFPCSGSGGEGVEMSEVGFEVGMESIPIL